MDFSPFMQKNKSKDGEFWSDEKPNCTLPVERQFTEQSEKLIWNGRKYTWPNRMF